MTQSSQSNPYAPSRLSGLRPPEPSGTPHRVSIAMVVLATFCGVVISGGAFDAITALLIGLLGSGVPELSTLIPLGLMADLMVTGIVSVPAVFVAGYLCWVIRSRSQGW